LLSLFEGRKMDQISGGLDEHEPTDGARGVSDKSELRNLPVHLGIIYSSVLDYASGLDLAARLFSERFEESHELIISKREELESIVKASFDKKDEGCVRDLIISMVMQSDLGHPDRLAETYHPILTAKEIAKLTGLTENKVLGRVKKNELPYETICRVRKGPSYSLSIVQQKAYGCDKYLIDIFPELKEKLYPASPEVQDIKPRGINDNHDSPPLIACLEKDRDVILSPADGIRYVKEHIYSHPNGCNSDRLISWAKSVINDAFPKGDEQYTKRELLRQIKACQSE
jgi:hypothetical protein